jgi:prepilin-type N-terminal cleavage/methylation domain-containing protein/prepilin-type processing-associated H-X9-DG protein
MKGHAMRQKNGFTLIELLVVISIIALLVGILLPALGAARETAKSAVCKSNQRQIGIAWTVYANDFKEFYPPSYHGGFWSVIYKSTKDYMDDAGIGGEAFFCPTHVERITGTNGQYLDWDNLGNLGPIHGPFVLSSYNYWTNFVQAPYINRWKSLIDAPMGTWPEGLVSTRVSLPWLIRASDERLSEKRIAWDEVYFRSGSFNPVSTRHMRGSDGSGANILFGDGHADWIGIGQMHPVEQGNGFTNYY